MPGQRLNTAGAKGELLDQFLRFIGLQVEQRFLQEGQAGLFFRGQPRNRMDCIRLCERGDVCQKLCNGGPFRDLRLHGSQGVRGQSALFAFEHCANSLAPLYKLVEQVQPKGPERDVCLFGEVDGRTVRIEHAHAGNELIFAGSSPFPQFRFGSDLVLD